jgi:hypothetical protein
LLSCVFFLQSCAKPSSEKADAPSKQVSQTYTSLGQATIVKGAVQLARKQAFSDAISKTSLEANQKVSSQTLLASTKVVDEWIADDVYYIQVVSELTEGLNCSSPYRKRMLATGFPIVTSGQISTNETQDLYSGIPREIMNSLVESGGFLAHNATHTQLFAKPDIAPELVNENGSQNSMIMQLADKHGAQFVLSGVIRDLQTESTEYVRGAGALAKWKSLTRDFIARRGLSIDIYVYDGMKGTLLFQQRYTDTVVGDVWIPSGYTVGSELFRATPTGHKISNIIQLASKDIRELFGCYSFSAKVIKVENQQVFISAGTQNKLKQGDSFVVYASNSSVLGNKLLGTVNIVDVQANFSIGEMEAVSDLRKIKAGDWVKSQ